MKQKFLLILRKLNRRYSHPLAIFRKNRWGLHYGICAALWVLRQEGEDYTLKDGEFCLLYILLKEEAKKCGGNVLINTGYFWPPGELKPRRKTIRAMIKRVEEAYEKEGKIQTAHFTSPTNGPYRER